MILLIVYLTPRCPIFFWVSENRSNRQKSTSYQILWKWTIYTTELIHMFDWLQQFQNVTDYAPRYSQRKKISLCHCSTGYHRGVWGLIRGDEMQGNMLQPPASLLNLIPHLQEVSSLRFSYILLFFCFVKCWFRSCNCWNIKTEYLIEYPNQ